MPNNPLFDVSTRRKELAIPTLTRPAGTGGGITTQPLPRSGILQAIWLAISGTIAGTLSAPNALGLSSFISRVSLDLNNGVQIINISGAGFSYLLREAINDFLDGLTYQDGRAAVTATTFEMDMLLPVALNNRDQHGLIMLQDDTITATLTVQWSPDATLATGVTSASGTCKPTLVVYEVPTDKAAWPDFAFVHQTLESEAAIPSTADFRYDHPRGGIYVGSYMLAPSGFTAAKLYAQEANLINQRDIDSNRLAFVESFRRDPVLSGALSGFDKRIFWDFMSTDGLGAYGTTRDVINSGRLTDLHSVVTPTASQTLKVINRWLLPVGQQQAA